MLEAPGRLSLDDRKGRGYIARQRGVQRPRGKDEMTTAILLDDPTAAIDKLKELQPGWDSYGAETIGPSERENAKGFVTRVLRTLGPDYLHMKVGPTADGGVALIWRGRDALKVEAFFSPAGNRYLVFSRKGLVDRGPLTGTEFLKQYLAP